LNESSGKNVRLDSKPWFFIALVTVAIGISYFDQTRMSWFALLAMISAALAAVKKPPSGKSERTSVSGPSALPETAFSSRDLVTP